MAKEQISGVYETLRSFHGKFALLAEHQERMTRSCKELGLAVVDLAEIALEFEEQADVLSGKKDVRLRVAVDLSGEIEVKHFDLPYWYGSFLYDEVWKVKPVRLDRLRPDLKSTNIKGQLDAREEAAKDGFGEILLVSEDGFIREGGITNVFFVEGGCVGNCAENGLGGVKLITPGDGMLPGISRQLVLQACKELGIEVELRAVHENELAGFEAVFLTNSIRGMISTGKLVPVMEEVAEWVTEFINKRIK